MNATKTIHPLNPLHHALITTKPTLLTALLPILPYPLALTALNTLEHLLNTTGYPLDWALSLAARYPNTIHLINFVGFPLDSIRYAYWHYRRGVARRSLKVCEQRLQHLPELISDIHARLPAAMAQATRHREDEERRARALRQRLPLMRDWVAERQRRHLALHVRAGDEKQRHVDSLRRRRPELVLEQRGIVRDVKRRYELLEADVPPRRGWLRLVEEGWGDEDDGTGGRIWLRVVVICTEVFGVGCYFYYFG